jgi:cation diffusion facilitator CzcD-associated flavoprotein CzcO
MDRSSAAPADANAEPLPDAPLPAIVVGAGPAGLATSAELTRRGIAHVVLERGPTAGHSWANFYDSLTLHTGRHLSSLPGMRFPRGTPLFPTRAQFVEYLHAYVRRFRLPVRTGVDVERVERDAEGWLLHTSRSALRSSTLVWAAGIASSPRVPDLPGRDRYRGRLLHSSEYRRPDGFAGLRVLVVGTGNSGGEIASELARAGARVTVAVRSGANVVPLQLMGIPIQYLSRAVRTLPRAVQERVVAAVGALTTLRRGPPVLPRPAHGPLDAIPLIGFSLVDGIRAGRIAVRGALDSLTASGARFADGQEEPFDAVILATGFTAALAPLGNLVSVDARGFALRTDRVASAGQPGLWFVGHNYDSSGGLFNIARDARIAAKQVAESLGK